jgi:molybdopterin synthase catalytic subunit
MKSKGEILMEKQASVPSVDQWLKEAKEDPSASECGMYLIHNGTVRQTARAMVRQGADNTEPVTGMVFRRNAEKIDQAVRKAKEMPGIFYVRVWLNEGVLTLGDDIMLVLVGGDIRPHVIDALQSLVGTIKNECVIEQELF